MNRVKRGVIAAVAAALGTAAFPAVASADASPISVNLGSGWVDFSSAPLFSFDKIMPGDIRNAAIQIRNNSATATDLTLSTTDIVEFENGCTAAEADVDSTCGATEGEIGRHLSFAIFADPEDDGVFEPAPRWTGTLYDLSTPADLLDGIAGNGVVGLRIQMILPLTTGNDTQSDQADFSFRLTLTGAGSPDSPGGSTSGSGPSAGSGPDSTPQGPGSVEVKGVKVTRHQHSNVLHDITSQLPFTGTPTERLVAGALWLLVAGTALSLLAATRRRRTAED